MPSALLPKTLQVMKLRRRFDDLSGEVSRLNQQRELLLTQMADEQAEWEKRQQVGWLAQYVMHGRAPRLQPVHTIAAQVQVTQPNFQLCSLMLACCGGLAM